MVGHSRWKAWERHVQLLNRSRETQALSISNARRPAREGKNERQIAMVGRTKGTLRVQASWIPRSTGLMGAEVGRLSAEGRQVSTTRAGRRDHRRRHLWDG